MKVLLSYLKKILNYILKSMPWDNGNLFEKFVVTVARLMYAFQASEPDSRPPPVSFSPPNAAPISAPLRHIFTFTIPQSEPLGPINFSASIRSRLKIH